MRKTGEMLKMSKLQNRNFNISGEMLKMLKMLKLQGEFWEGQSS